jgi:hypothetical protein
VSNMALATCGSSCTACPASPANGMATCNGTACGFTCNTGYHACGSACVSNMALATCGSSCTACPAAPNNGTATCDGVICGYTCDTNYHPCGSTCALNTAVATCGSSCTACPTLTGATASCNGTACGLTCNANYNSCTHLSTFALQSCSAKTYNFNDGTQQGFVAHPTYTPASVGVSTAIRRGSSGASLYWDMVLTASSPTPRNGVRLKFCPSGYVDLENRTITAWAYIAGPAFPSCSGDRTFGMNVTGTSGSGFPANIDNPTIGSWFQITGTINSDNYNRAHTVDLSLNLNCSMSWSGTVYIDDVVING